MKKLLVLIIIFNCQFFIVNCTAQSVTTMVLSNVSCYGLSNGSARANPLGGLTPYTYQWLPGGQTSQTATGLTAGAFTIHLTDHLGRTASAVAIISQPAALSVTASAKLTSVCAGQSDSLFATASGGTLPFSYSWTGPLDDISNPSAAKTLCYPYGAAYIVTAIYDLNGCSASASISVGVHPIPLTTISGPISPIAPGRSDTLIALAAGATSYLWSNSSTVSSIIVSPAVSTTYSVKATNTYGCYDTAHYTIDTNSIGNGTSSSNAIRIVPSTNVVTSSFSTLDSVVWFSFVAADSNNQIIANSAFLGMPVPHVHRLTLFNNLLQTLVDEPMPDMVGANQIRLDISHLQIGNTYYVRAARTPAHANMAGCNPSPTGECNPTQRWDFQMCFRTVPVFVPDDSGAEPPSVSQLYYEDRGQIADLNDIPRFDLKAYTNFSSPSVYASDSAVSFVYSSIDSMQRVDMELTGTYVQPSQPVFKMEEDSNAGYLNYFKEFIENGVPKIEGYSRLVYKNVYPSVDMQIFSNTLGTKLYFICNPTVGTSSGGNPADIELQFTGANSVSVNGGGGINVVTDFGTLNFAPGYAYTDSAGIIKPKSWQAYFVAVNSNTVKFNTGSFNSNEPLIIQVDRGHKITNSYPTQQNLVWNTYYGGTDAGNLGAFLGVCHDDSGNVYTTGYTTSLHFPVTVNLNGQPQVRYKGDTDVIAVKFNTGDSKLKWATYYGGTGADIGRGIAVDDGGIIYITGSTNSTDLRTLNYKNGSYFQKYLNGNNSGPNTDAFIVAFSPSGPTVRWGTYYGGPGIESGHAIAVDKQAKEVYIVGDADSASPHFHKPGAYNDSNGAALIAEFGYNNFSGAYVQSWGVDMGQPGLDSSGFNGCAVDLNGNFYVTGASGADYPTTDYLYSGRTDAIFTQFNSTGDIVYSTYFGGTYKDVANGITTDGYGNAYITGHSYSYQLPYGADPNSWMYVQDTNGNGPTNHVNGNAFIAEFSSLYGLQWSTFFGGVGDIDGTGITADGNNNIYITGYVEINDSAFLWPANQPANAYVRNFNMAVNEQDHETFLAAFNAGGGYYWGTYLGGYNYLGESVGYGITAYNNKNLYVAGNAPEGTPLDLVNPGAGAWFQDTIDHATSIATICKFNLIGITTGENQLKVDNGQLKAYPNPTNENVTVEFNMKQMGNVEYTLYNFLGEPVYSAMDNKTAGNITKQIPLFSLPNGNYIVQVIAGNNIYHAKITKLQ